jgi:hypothetical protein
MTAFEWIVVIELGMILVAVGKIALAVVRREREEAFVRDSLKPGAGI